MENKEQKEKCKFGGCQHYLTCIRTERPCERYEKCETYMDNYDNDLNLWAEMHGETNCDYHDDYDGYDDYEDDSDYEDEEWED